MTTQSDSAPWRERNLQRLAEARRILEQARALRPERDADAGSGDGSPDPDNYDKENLF